MTAVPASQLVPGVFVAVEASQAAQGAPALPYRALIVGQKLVGGSAASDSIHRVTSADAVAPLAGRGSMLHRMAIAWYSSNRATETWIGVLADDGAGVAATGTITVTGPATAAGTIALYLGAVRITIGVSDAQADTVIAASIDAAINAALDLPVTSSNALAIDTVTFRHKGEVGNSYDIRHSVADGEELPAGVGLAIVQVGGVVAGTANPTLTGLIAALGDEWFQVWSHPYTDATNLTAIETELDRRNGPTVMIDGVAVTSAAGTFGTLSALGDSRNSKFSVIVAQAGQDPLTPPMEYAAEVGAIVAREGELQPNRPFNTLSLVNAFPIDEIDRFSFEERDMLLRDSIATSKNTATGQVQLERLVTTFQLNAGGLPDTTYQDISTPLTLIFLRFAWRARMTAFDRHLLVDDATRVNPGIAVMSPALGRAEAIGWFKEMEGLALVQGLDQFKRDLVVFRDLTDRTRMVFELSPTLVPGLQIQDTTILFRF